MNFTFTLDGDLRAGAFDDRPARADPEFIVGQRVELRFSTPYGSVRYLGRDVPNGYRIEWRAGVVRRRYRGLSASLQPDGYRYDVEIDGRVFPARHPSSMRSCP